MRLCLHFSLSVALLFCCWLLPNTAVQAQPPLYMRDVVGNLDTPWEILWGKDNHIWFTEHYGRISRVNPATGELHVLARVEEVWEGAESGMLGMTLHRDFPDSPYVFVVYTYLQKGVIWIAEKLVRFRYDAARDTLVEPRALLDTIHAGYYHSGSRLVTLDDGTILMTTGEQGAYETQMDAQNQNLINGKVLRINPDGTVPADNPWPNNPWPASLLWTTGHRNPQGLTVGKGGIVYSSEHGPAEDDELNIIQRGRNYGWPLVHGYCDDWLFNEKQHCQDSNMADPIHTWYAGQQLTAAPGDVVYYNHPLIPEWQNSLLVVTHKDGMYQFKLSEDGTRIVDSTRLFAERFGEQTLGRLRGICVAPDGRIFISTSNRDDRARSDLGFPRAQDDRIIELWPAKETGASISIPTVDRADYRAGNTLHSAVTLNGVFTPDNTLNVEISDEQERFFWKRTLTRRKSVGGTSTLNVSLPCDLPAGTYRIRVSTTNPPAISQASDSFTVAPKQQVTLSPSGTITLCQGDSVLLFAPDQAGSYRWLHGPTERSIVVRLAGTYTLIYTDVGGCTDTARATVKVQSPVQPTIAVADSVLTSSEARSYQWFRNNQALQGETGQSITVTVNGRYSVQTVDSVGCVGVSEMVQMIVTGAPQQFRSEQGISIEPHPVETEALVGLGREFGEGRVEVIGMAGRVVQTEAFRGGRIFRFNAANLPPGVYTLVISDQKKTIRLPVVVK